MVKAKTRSVASDTWAMYCECSPEEFVIALRESGFEGGESVIRELFLLCLVDLDTLMLCNKEAGFRPTETIPSAGSFDIPESACRDCWGIMAPPNGYRLWFALWDSCESEGYGHDYPVKDDTALIFYPKDSAPNHSIQIAYYSSWWQKYGHGNVLYIPWRHGVKGLAARALLPLRLLELGIKLEPLLSPNALSWFRFYRAYIFERHPAFTTRPALSC